MRTTAERRKKIIVIGAGIAGLMAAKHLKDGGMDVTVLDKARGVGGRMSTSRLGDLRFDQGAQFFQCSHPIFEQIIKTWEDEKIAIPWTLPNGSPMRQQSPFNGPAWYGESGMSALPKRLAAELDVRLNERVARLDSRPGGWRMWTESASVYEPEGLIMTLPAPQAGILLGKVAHLLPKDIPDLIATVKYQPLYSLIVQLDRPTDIKPPGVMIPEDSSIDWIVDNSVKGVSKSGTAITVLATPEFSTKYEYEPVSSVKEKLWEEASRYVDAGAEQLHVHRWRYAWPIQPLEEPIVVQRPAPLVLAGDGFAGCNKRGLMIEAAALSGLSAAASLFEQLAT